MSEVLRLRDEKLEWREIDGEVVALDGQHSEYLGVNRSGAVLWPLLAEGATREALADRLCESFGIEPAQAAQDVKSFVESLVSRGLLAE